MSSTSERRGRNEHIGCDCRRCATAAAAARGIVERYQRGERETVVRMLAIADPATLFAVAVTLGASRSLDPVALSTLHHFMLVECGGPPAPSLELTPMGRV